MGDAAHCPECGAAARTRSRESRVVRRWAITTAVGLLGVGRFQRTQVSYPYRVPAMIFRTRREARKALPSVKGPKDRGLYPDARVVRVSVTIQVEE